MRNIAAAAMATLALSAACAAAQVTGIQRQVLERSTTADGEREVLLVRVEIAPGASAGRHSHPGIETGCVLEGEAVMEIDGEAPRKLGPGDTYLIAAGRIHDARAQAARIGLA